MVNRRWERNKWRESENPRVHGLMSRETMAIGNLVELFFLLILLSIDCLTRVINGLNL